MPSECAASVWPGSTDWIPARTISLAYAASFNPSARSAAAVGVSRALVSAWRKVMWVNGTPIRTCW